MSDGANDGVGLVCATVFLCCNYPAISCNT